MFKIVVLVVTMAGQSTEFTSPYSYTKDECEQQKNPAIEMFRQIYKRQRRGDITGLTFTAKCVQDGEPV